MDWFKNHVDAVLVLGGILGSLIWMNGKFNQVDKEIAMINSELRNIKTVLMLKEVYPKELAINDEEKKLW